MPKKTIRILSTRPLAATLLDEGKANGMVIDARPFILTEPVEEQSLINRIRDLSTQPLIALFTSMNAVEVIVRHLTPLQRPPWQIFCIGGATRQQIRDYFGEDRISGTAPSAAQLAEVILQWYEQTTDTPGPAAHEIFFFCGDQRREELPDRLKQASVNIHELVVYHTLLIPQTIDERYDGVVFFSPSAVHSFFTRNTLPPDTVLFAIGQTTADCIRTYTPNTTILSATPEKENLIRQAIDYFQTNHISY